MIENSYMQKFAEETDKNFNKNSNELESIYLMIKKEFEKNFQSKGYNLERFSTHKEIDENKYQYTSGLINAYMG
jgi:hypothetical protein